METIDKFKLIYIDDNIDNDITCYLRKNFNNENIEYYEREFKTTETYSDLLNDDKVKTADIIIIDSKLFENRNVNKKFTGEQFKLIVAKEFPYKKVFVISRNDDVKTVGYIKKKNFSNDVEFKKYYDKELKLKIQDAMNNIIADKKLVDEMLQNNVIDPIILEKIRNSFLGIKHFDDLKSDDIDKIISLFNELMQ